MNDDIQRIRELAGLSEAWNDDGEPLYDLAHYTTSASAPFMSGGKLHHILSEVEEILTNQSDGLVKLVITPTPDSER